MPIARANVETKTKVKAKKDEMPEFKIKGVDVRAFNQAVQDAKDAKSAQDDAREVIMEEALPLFFKHCETNEAVSSIKIVDEVGATCRLTLQDRYSACDCNAANAIFEDLGYDAGDYALETVSANFDSKVFITNDGQFNEGLYKDMVEAVARIAKKHNVSNPLSCSTKIMPKPDFHERRFREFTAEENRRLSEVIKCTITLTPVVGKE